jgi:hypothetical protein
MTREERDYQKDKPFHELIWCSTDEGSSPPFLHLLAWRGAWLILTCSFSTQFSPSPSLSHVQYTAPAPFTGKLQQNICHMVRGL